MVSDTLPSPSHCSDQPVALQVRIVKLTGKAYEQMRFKDALKYGFYGMQEARDRYRTGTAHVGACLEAVVVRRAYMLSYLPSFNRLTAVFS